MTGQEEWHEGWDDEWDDDGWDDEGADGSEEGWEEEGWGEEDADERAALESAIGKILEWQEQVVRENQQAAELLPLRAQLELVRAPARARTRELQCGDSD